MKRVVKWSLVAIVFLGGGWFCHALWRGHVYAQAYAAVARGDSEARVLKLFGSPHRVSGRPESIAWGTEDSIAVNAGDCLREFWYAPPISIDGEAWTIGFDSHSNVVSKYNYHSP